MNKPKRVNKICYYCHKGFKAPLKDVKRGYGNYCGRSCARRAHKTGAMSIVAPTLDVSDTQVPKASISTILTPNLESIKTHCKTCSCYIYKHKEV